MPNMRVCEKCRVEKPIDQYPVLGSLGRGLWCSLCVSEHNNRPRELDTRQLTKAEKRKQYHTEYYKRNRDVMLQRAKDYQRAHYKLKGRKRPAETTRAIQDVGGTICSRCGNFTSNDQIAYHVPEGGTKKLPVCFSCIDIITSP